MPEVGVESTQDQPLQGEAESKAWEQPIQGKLAPKDVVTVAKKELVLAVPVNVIKW